MNDLGNLKVMLAQILAGTIVLVRLGILFLIGPTTSQSVVPSKLCIHFDFICNYVQPSLITKLLEYLQQGSEWATACRLGIGRCLPGRQSDASLGSRPISPYFGQKALVVTG